MVKGPQSAFFGRATFAGAVNFITKDPSFDLGGRAFARVATDDTYELAGALEGPILRDKLLARVSARYDYFGGQYENVLTGDQLGEQEFWMVSGSLLALPTDRIEVRLRGSYTDQQDGPPASQLIGRLPQHNCGPFGGTNNNSPLPATLFCGVLEFDGPAGLNPIGPSALARDPDLGENGFDRGYYILSAQADFEFGNGYTLTSLTGYQNEKQDLLRDFDITPTDAYQAELSRRQEAFSQELRLSSPQAQRFRWLVGLYYIEQDYTSGGVFIVGEDNPFAAFFGGRGAQVLQPVDAKVIQNKAVFGAVSYDILDELTLSLEGRFQKEEVENTLGASSFAFTTEKFLPRVILDYKPTPDLTIYASVAKGNKPTQGNAAVLELSPERQVIGEQNGLFLVAPEEEITNYEIGVKSQFADGRGFVNVAAFYADWEGKQTVGGVNIDFNNDGIIDVGAQGPNRERFNGVVIQAGDVKAYGFEVEAAYDVTPALTIGGNVAYNRNDLQDGYYDVLYERFYGSRNASGQKDGQVPDVTFNTYADYLAPLTNDLDLFARADLLFEGSQYASILNTAKTGDSYQVNLRAGVQQDTWRLTAYVENLFDDDTVERLSYQGDSALDPARFAVAAYEAGLPKKRQFGVTASLEF